MNPVTFHLYSDTLVWVLFILLYAVFEYQRREQHHKMTLLALRYGKEPPPFEPKHELWKFATTGIVAIMLFAGAAGFVMLKRSSTYGGRAFDVLAFLFLAIGVALIIILVRDIRTYHHNRKFAKE